MRFFQTAPTSIITAMAAVIATMPIMRKFDALLLCTYGVDCAVWVDSAVGICIGELVGVGHGVCEGVGFIVGVGLGAGIGEKDGVGAGVDVWYVGSCVPYPMGVYCSFSALGYMKVI